MTHIRNTGAKFQFKWMLDFSHELLGIQSTIISYFSLTFMCLSEIAFQSLPYVFSLDIPCGTLPGGFILALLLHVVSKNLKMDSYLSVDHCNYMDMTQASL